MPLTSGRTIVQALTVPTSIPIYTSTCTSSLAFFVKFPDEPIDPEPHILLRSLPVFHYTAAAIDELSRANDIVVVTIRSSWQSNQRAMLFLCPQRWCISLSARTQPLLELTILTASSARSSTCALNRLYVNSYTDHTPTKLHTFFVTLSEQCQLLSKLNAQFYHKLTIVDLVHKLPTRDHARQDRRPHKQVATRRVPHPQLKSSPSTENTLFTRIDNGHGLNPSRVVERGMASKRRPRGTRLEITHDRLDGGVGRQRCSRQTYQNEDQVPRVEDEVLLVCKEKCVSTTRMKTKRIRSWCTYNRVPIGKRSTS